MCLPIPFENKALTPSPQGAHGALVRDDAWGIGHQTSFLLDVLCAVDTDYRSSFGWRQATVWGVEEPESGLHVDLEMLVAENLRLWCDNPRKRLQVLVTTHSPVIAMASHAGHLVKLSSGATDVEPMDVAALVREAGLTGITRWSQPLLSFPFNTVILVEGPIDAQALSYVASVAGRADLRFMALPDIDPAETGGGKDAITKYLSLHGALINNRPKESPLLVLLDWETSDQELRKARAAYGEDGDDRVLRADAAYCNGEVGRDFRGIERFYPTHVVEAAVQAGELAAARNAEGIWTVSKAELARAKWPLLVRLQEEASLEDLGGLPEVLSDVLEAAHGATAGFAQRRLRPT